MEHLTADQRSRLCANRSCRGLTRTEILVSVFCTTALVAIITLVWFQTRGSPTAVSRMLRDAEQLRQIHQGMLLGAREADGRYPQPGDVRRHPIERDGELIYIPRSGRPDPSQDTTANFYSLLVMHRYVGADQLVSPGDRSPLVKPIEQYDFDAYDPSRGVFWDDALAADLEHNSHVSYAHDLLYGERVRRHWRADAPPNRPVIGSRGPRNGTPDPASYTCDHQGNWRGVIVDNANNYEHLEHFTPANLFVGEDRNVPDNIFRIDDGAEGEDVILTFTLEITPDDPIIQHD